jgi:hypothetical protein
MGGLFLSTITTNVFTRPDSNTIIVSSISTSGPAAYDVKALTIATLNINGFTVDSATLIRGPAFYPQGSIDLGSATLTIPHGLMGEITVTTSTIWTLPIHLGNIPITQLVTVKINNYNK